MQSSEGRICDSNVKDTEIKILVTPEYMRTVGEKSYTLRPILTWYHTCPCVLQEDMP